MTRSKPIELTPVANSELATFRSSGGRVIETVPAGKRRVLLRSHARALTTRNWRDDVRVVDVPFPRLVGYVGTQAAHAIGFVAMTPDDEFTPQSLLYVPWLSSFGRHGTICLNSRADGPWLHRLFLTAFGDWLYNTPTDSAFPPELAAFDDPPTPNPLQSHSLRQNYLYLNWEKLSELTVADIQAWSWSQVKPICTVADIDEMARLSCTV